MLGNSLRSQPKTIREKNEGQTRFLEIMPKGNEARDPPGGADSILSFQERIIKPMNVGLNYL